MDSTRAIEMPKPGAWSQSGNTIGALALRLNLLALDQVEKIIEIQRTERDLFGELAGNPDRREASNITGRGPTSHSIRAHCARSARHGGRFVLLLEGLAASGWRFPRLDDRLALEDLRAPIWDGLGGLGARMMLRCSEGRHGDR